VTHDWLFACAGLLAALGLVACDTARPLTAGETQPVDACTQCHGSPGDPAPPRSVLGDTDTASVSVGAHQAHLRGGALRGPIACEECHVVPTSIESPGHMGSAHAPVIFGPLATTGGAQPAWDHDTATCSSTYCHGATLASGSNTTAGGAPPLVPRNTAPIWNVVDGTQAYCGACHGLPPDTGQHAYHAGLGRDCDLCHDRPYSTKTDVGPPAVDPVRHMNGIKDVPLVNWDPNVMKSGSTTERGTSTGCHGGTRYWYVTSGSCL